MYTKNGNIEKKKSMPPTMLHNLYHGGTPTI